MTALIVVLIGWLVLSLIAGWFASAFYRAIRDR